MKCNNCGAEVSNANDFCPRCGHAMETPSSATQRAGSSGAQKTNPPATHYPPQGYYPPTSPQVIMTTTPQSPSNGLAVAGFVCSLISLLLPFGIIFSLLGMIFSAVGLSKAKKINGTGKGLAIAGIILSIPTLIAGVMLILLWAGLLNGALSAITAALF